ncbi:MAG: crotonase/enoyl-CoA hydratase family protein [Acidimicrobiales bacterium]|nr:crotonase/enoyl-CoA hydratase family protein [Acidimicrobiales bacterium]
MTERVRYALRDGIGWIDLDDGKANALSPAMQSDIDEALDRALEDDAPVVIRGRDGVFSGGFDMGVLTGGGQASIDMVLGGFRLAARILGHPRPVVVACTGHAMAMGLFLVLAGDHRIGIDRPAKLAANEVAIGLTLPRTATEMLRQRLTPAAFPRAAMLSETFDPPAAVAAGILDEIVPADAFEARVHEVATGLLALDVDAQKATKQRVREPLLEVIEAAIAQDQAEQDLLLAAAG